MYLRSLRLKDFAGLSDTHLPFFAPGLNVVVGDNESGKSTLLSALRAAFFQRHRAQTEAVRALVPYGRQVRPQVDVEFDVDGTSFTLRKAFLQRPEAELSWPSGHLTGDAVEERLSELFRFTHSAARKPKDGDFAGAFGLLWADQGRSFQGLDLGEGRDAVTASLEGEVGQILGGERGRALLAAARRLQDRFFTPSLRQKSDSPLREAEDRLSAAQGELERSRLDFSDYEEKIERLRRARATLAANRDERRVELAEAAVAAAEERCRRIEGMRRDFVDAEAALARAEGDYERAVRENAARLALQSTLNSAREAAESSAAGRLALQEDGRALRQTLDECATERDAAREGSDAAERAEEDARHALEHARLTLELGHARARFEEAAEIEAALGSLRAAIAVTRIDAAALGGLQAAETALQEAEIRLSATAGTISFEPMEGQTVMTGDGRPVDLSRPIRLSRPLTLDLGGFGRIRVDPGIDSAKLEEDAAEARRVLKSRLGALNVASLAEAHAVLRSLETQKTELAFLERQLMPESERGTGAWSARIKSLEASLAALPQRTEAPGAAAPHADRQDDLVRRKEEARRRSRAAETAFDRASAAFAVLQERIVRAETEADHRHMEVARLTAEWEEGERRRPLSAMRDDLSAAEMARAAKGAVLALCRRSLEDAQPDMEMLRLNASRGALANLKEEVGRLERECATLEGELSIQGAGALGEAVTRLEGEVERLELRRRRLALEAEASRLLHATLLDAQRAARDQWLGPIRAEIAPYLRLVHPESEVELDDETLEIRALHRRGVEEAFGRLSLGAREQVAVLTRLALAQVLRKGGQPAAVILDDALVNTDETRLERMHLALLKASEHLQIIILTCRERDFRALGAATIRL